MIKAMDRDTRAYQFVMTIEIEPDHVAYLDPEWAADAAAGALTNEYGLAAFYSLVESVGDDSTVVLGGSGDSQRAVRYRFVTTFQVEADQPAFDDPEWAADAAHGALTNEYGIAAVYTDLRPVALG